MKVFTIIIWKYTKEVKYKTYNEANCYAHGVFDAMNLLGKKPTGISIKE